MPGKNSKAKTVVKIDLSKLGVNSDNQSVDWAADRPAACAVAASPLAPTTPSTSSSSFFPSASNKGGAERHVRGLQAATIIGNFREPAESSAAAAAVPLDMPPPYVAFVKHFGRGCTEEVFRNYFPTAVQVVVVNSSTALYALLECGSRGDLIKALSVTGTKMMYQYACTVDVAKPAQADKMRKMLQPLQPRQRPATASAAPPRFDFDRDEMMGTASAAPAAAAAGSTAHSAGSAPPSYASQQHHQKKSTSVFTTTATTTLNFDRNSIFGTSTAATAAETNAPPPPPTSTRNNFFGSRAAATTQARASVSSERSSTSVADVSLSRESLFGGGGVPSSPSAISPSVSSPASSGVANKSPMFPRVRMFGSSTTSLNLDADRDSQDE